MTTIGPTYPAHIAVSQAEIRLIADQTSNAGALTIKLDQQSVEAAEQIEPAEAKCRVRSKALWQIAPGCARPQYPEDAVEDTSVVDPRHAARLVRKERPDGSPLKVREFVSHDTRPPFGVCNTELQA
jgi:hypothetical protein